MSPGSYNAVPTLGSLEPGTHECAFHHNQNVTNEEQAEAVLHNFSSVADGFRAAAEQLAP